MFPWSRSPQGPYLQYDVVGHVVHADAIKTHDVRVVESVEELGFADKVFDRLTVTPLFQSLHGYLGGFVLLVPDVLTPSQEYHTEVVTELLQVFDLGAIHLTEGFDHFHNRWGENGPIEVDGVGLHASQSPRILVRSLNENSNRNSNQYDNDEVACVCVCVCVCVCGREGGGGGEMCVCVCVHVCVWVWEGGGGERCVYVCVCVCGREGEMCVCVCVWEGGRDVCMCVCVWEGGGGEMYGSRKRRVRSSFAVRGTMWSYNRLDTVPLGA